jgi:hypothetical protein
MLVSLDMSASLGTVEKTPRGCNVRECNVRTQRGVVAARRSATSSRAASIVAIVNAACAADHC